LANRDLAQKRGSCGEKFANWFRNATPRSTLQPIVLERLIRAVSEVRVRTLALVY